MDYIISELLFEYKTTFEGQSLRATLPFHIKLPICLVAKNPSPFSTIDLTLCMFNKTNNHCCRSDNKNNSLKLYTTAKDTTH